MLKKITPEKVRRFVWELFIVAFNLYTLSKVENLSRFAKEIAMAHNATARSLADKFHRQDGINSVVYQILQEKNRASRVPASIKPESDKTLEIAKR